MGEAGKEKLRDFSVDVTLFCFVVGFCFGFLFAFVILLVYFDLTPYVGGCD